MQLPADQTAVYGGGREAGEAAGVLAPASCHSFWLTLPMTESELGGLGSREGVRVPAFEWTFSLALCHFH